MAKEPFEVIAEEIDKKMDEYIDVVFGLSQQRLVDDGKIDTGTMLKTANINRKFLEKEIVYPVNYASDIEYGRVVGTMPPVNAIEPWVRRKLGVSNPKKARGIAWAIAKSIKSRGIQPSPFLRPAIDKARTRFDL